MLTFTILLEYFHAPSRIWPIDTSWLESRRPSPIRSPMIETSSSVGKDRLPGFRVHNIDDVAVQKRAVIL